MIILSNEIENNYFLLEAQTSVPLASLVQVGEKVKKMDKIKAFPSFPL